MASDFTLQNMEDGFPEAFLRGLRSTFLTDGEYMNLKEGGSRGGAGDKGKEDFEDLRLTMQETDYGNFLSNEVRKHSAAPDSSARETGRASSAHHDHAPTLCAPAKLTLLRSSLVLCSPCWTPRSSRSA